MNECSNGRLVSFLLEGDDVVSCEVCLEPFQPLNRPPKILPCGHNFCDQCLFSLCCHQQYYLLDSIKCPTCRSSFPTNVAIEAPTNWDLCKILENVQKGREVNVTVIHVPDTAAQAAAEITSSALRVRRSLTRTASKSHKERCTDCCRKLSSKILGKAARFCEQCNSKEKMSFTCLECCVNKHNGHTLLSLSQLEAEQLKVLGELRELRRMLVDTFSSSSSLPGQNIRNYTKPSSAAESDSLLTCLTKLDAAIKVVETSAVISPKKLCALHKEQIQQCAKLFTSNPALQDDSVADLENSKVSSYSQSTRVTLRSASFHNSNSLSLLIPLLPRTPLSKELSLLTHDLALRHPDEQRCEAFLKSASIITSILFEDVPVEQLPVFSDALLHCFCQANILSRKKQPFPKGCSRRVIWKRVQLAYTELMRHTSKSFLSYEPERVAILGDLAFLCSMYADVCDQATVTICMIEAARARVSEERLSEHEKQSFAQSLKEIDDHLLECRRLQKLQDLCTTKKKRSGKIKWLWKFIFRRCKQRK
ncbi:unnamed protein product [Heligmosomoides polygyrus]|uniref:RING-type domain-containing protein n=1 Tax=Heligmosomoides polygyrus TaxID=6339 RepID=A0A183FT91_HELPZ|nr:unnamed protein product [Heligmosomoides polygyrus]